MSKWQPIETAPKDGTAILLFGYLEHEITAAPYGPAIYIAEYYVDHYQRGSWSIVSNDYYESVVNNPTHWMPLPAPPEEDNE